MNICTFAQTCKCQNGKSFKIAKIELLFFLLFGVFPVLVKAESFGFQNPFLIPGRVEGKGRYFEIKESEYLNVSLKSDKEVRVILESMPKLISLMIEGSEESGPEKANLIIENLEPNKIYYKYEDSYKNITEVYSGNEGKYEWEQDLSKPHHIWFQEEKSTIFLPRDCSNYGSWETSTQTCILEKNLDQSVEIGEDNIVLNCANYSIVGNGEGYGIYLNSKSGVTVKNCKVQNFTRGLSLSSSGNNRFENNNFSNNWSGVYLHASNNNELRQNIVENNSWSGLELDYYSQNNTLRGNQMRNNKYNFYSFGYENDIDTTNLVDEKPIYYLIDASNITLDSSSNAGTIYCIRCTNITIKDLNLKNNFSGIFLKDSQDLKIEDNQISNNNIGIFLLHSQRVIIVNNTLIDNYLDIYLDSSRNNLLKDNIIKNKIFDNNSGGISLYNSNNNTLFSNNFFKKGIILSSSYENILSQNEIFNSPYGITIALSSSNDLIENFLSENDNGIYFNFASQNILKNNKIEKSRYFGLHLYLSTKNLITQNTLVENATGIYILDSTENSIYHNNFINNQTQAITNNQKNFFDDGYPEGGNYWSDYTGIDEKSGENQDQEGSDGIGDTPYCFSGGCDRYPLMKEKDQILLEILISEVYFNPDSLHGVRGKGEWENEWIELRNLGSKEIDISGWTISDNHGTTTILNSPLIPPGGFVIITPTSSTFNFWPEIPEKTIKIVLGEKIGNGLANDSDFIILKDKEGEIVDSICWGSEENCIKNGFSYACPNPKEGSSLEKKPFVLKQNSNFCSFFEQKNPNPGKSALDFYWHKEIEDPKDTTSSGYEIISAKIVKGKEEILNFLPPLQPGPLCETLIAKLELKEILRPESYSEFNNQEGYGGVGMKIEAGNKTYLFAFDLSNSFESWQFLFLSENGQNWQFLASNSGDYFIYPFENSIIFALNMEKLPPLPWKLNFISGFIYENLKNYEIFDQTKEIEVVEGENQLPTPIINFFPRNPVKKTEVNFDASLSTDPDGQILGFFWEIKKEEEILATFSGTTTSFIFPENGEYQITLTVRDSDGATSSTSTIIKVEPFSFAIITDLHIGWGIPDYDGEGYDDEKEGQDYYITERLKMVVDWINENYEKQNIKFVVILGDISDTAEYSEFLKAREILNQLEIPYIPLIGNHDIWPNTQKSTTDPDGVLGRWNTIKEKRKEDEPLGDEYFEIVFWRDNATNTQKIKALFDSFERQEEHEEFQGPPYFQNYSFSFGGTTFIALDFNAREYKELIPPLSTTVYVWDDTLNWLEEKLKDREGEKVITFIHQPFVTPPSPISLYLGKLENIKAIIKKYCKGEESLCKIYNFAGHVHRNYVSRLEIPADDIIETEALLQSPLSVGPLIFSSRNFLRIVQITGSSPTEIEYNIFASGFPKAINPFITTNKEKPGVDESITFTAHTKNLEPDDISEYIWKFDENYSISCKRGQNECTISATGPHNIKKAECIMTKLVCTHGGCFPFEIDNECRVTYSATGTYKISLKVIPKDNLTYSEEISWSLKIGERKPRWKIFLPTSNLIPLLNGQENIILTDEENAQNTEEFVLLKKELASPSVPVGGFTVHFERATKDIDLSGLIAEIDPKKGKSILYMENWSEEIERSKILFVLKK